MVYASDLCFILSFHNHYVNKGRVRFCLMTGKEHYLPLFTLFTKVNMNKKTNALIQIIHSMTGM